MTNAQKLLMIGGAPWLTRRDYPKLVGGLEAWFDETDPSSMIMDSANRVSLISDKSGNSSTNVLCLNGVAGNYGSFTALSAVGTGAFSVSSRLSTASLAATQASLGGVSSSFSLRVIITTGKLEATKVGVSAVTQSTGTIAAFQDAVIGYTRTGTTGTYYINGVAVGTVVDATDYSVGISALGANGVGGSTNPFNGNVRWARVYSVALTGPEMLADANGTVQANCVFNQDFSGNAKLATSVTATTGGTVTINTSGATGARISGARDLYQGTAANQPILTIAAAGNYLTFDGSNDYLKAAAFALAQPETVYFVGSQVTWTDTDSIYDGSGASNRMKLGQATPTPNIVLFGGGSDAAANTGLATATNGIVTAVFNGASSSLRVNRGTATTGNPGTNAANGFTLGSRQDGGANANITAQEVLVYSGAHDKATQERVIAMLARKHRLPAV